MSGWDKMDPMAGKVAEMVNKYGNAGIFWDEPRDRAVALAIVEMVRKDERERCARQLDGFATNAGDDCAKALRAVKS